MNAFATSSSPCHATSGGRLVSIDGKELPLHGVALSARAVGGLARTVLEQRYRNPFAEPLQVTYSVPLPADGAVSGFTFQIGEERIVGRVERKQTARELFEQALIEGHTAALLEQERSSVFTQEVGNIPPGAEVVVALTVDQKLAWLPEGAWEWRFPTVIGPRYQGGDESERNVTVDVNDEPLPVRATLALRIEDRLADGRRPESPSHPLRTQTGLDATEVTLADGGVRLDRDLVVRWPASEREIGLRLAIARSSVESRLGDAAWGLLTVVPPARRDAPIARDLIVLLDTSGSMSGEPLAQAQKVVAALVQSLGEQDRLEMIEFSDRPRRWRKEPTPVTAKMRRDALDWLSRLRAGGGTEMRTAISESLAPLRPESQRQVVVVSDGLIGFESRVIAEVFSRLPSGCRLHTVGVGSSVNRSFTSAAARAGRGVELIIGLGEDPERAAQRLCAQTADPVLVDVEVSGSAVQACAPARLPDLFASAPALISLKLAPEGGDLVVRGRTAEGTWEQRLRVDPIASGTDNPALAALYGREAVEDCELRIQAGGDRSELEREIERLGLAHQISTRLTSWVAVGENRQVDPGAPTRRSVVPHELPYGTSAEGFGLRSALPVLSMSDATLAVGGVPIPRAPAMPRRRPAMPGRPAPVTGRSESEPFASASTPPMGRPSDLRQSVDAYTDEPAAVLDEGLAPPASDSALELPGRIVLAKDGRLVIAFELTTSLAFALPERASLTWEERTLEVEIDASMSTRSADLQPGQQVRIAVRLPTDVPVRSPEVLELVSGPVRLKVRIG